MKTSGAGIYEVRCPTCDVSFPPRTRSCLHCGQRIPRRAAPAPEAASHRDPFSPGAPSEVKPGSDPTPDFLEWAKADSAEETEAEQARPWWLRWGTNIIWVVVAILATLGQMCEGA